MGSRPDRQRLGKPEFEVRDEMEPIALERRRLSLPIARSGNGLLRRSPRLVTAGLDARGRWGDLRRRCRGPRRRIQGELAGYLGEPCSSNGRSEMPDGGGWVESLKSQPRTQLRRAGCLVFYPKDLDARGHLDALSRRRIQHSWPGAECHRIIAARCRIAWYCLPWWSVRFRGFGKLRGYG